VLLVGLTGSIACGKTAVSGMMTSRKGVVAINLDELAHEILRKGTRAAMLVAERFPDVVTNGEVDRTLLGPKIFNSVTDRRWLNGVMHWRIGMTLFLCGILLFFNFCFKK
jgi:dephospho-CoA kinase